MSKNGFRLFKNYNPYITSPFGYRIHPITKKRTLHAGVDYGTNNKNLAVYPLEDGEVLEVGYNSTSGNFIYVLFPRLNKVGLYEHLASINTKKGEKVNKNKELGKAGKTGAVTGVHLHFGWFNKSEYKKSWNARNWEDFEQYNYVEWKYLKTPTKRDKTKDQYEVKISNLYVRETPNGKILGYINKGIYNVLDTKDAGNYTWVKIDNNAWVAISNEFGTFYKKEEIKEASPKEVPIETNKEEENINDNLENSLESNMENKEDYKEKKNIFKVILEKIKEFFKKILKKLGIL